MIELDHCRVRQYKQSHYTRSLQILYFLRAFEAKVRIKTQNRQSVVYFWLYVGIRYIKKYRRWDNFPWTKKHMTMKIRFLHDSRIWSSQSFPTHIPKYLACVTRSSLSESTQVVKPARLKYFDWDWDLLPTTIALYLFYWYVACSYHTNPNVINTDLEPIF